jgi:hypothetical protein
MQWAHLIMPYSAAGSQARIRKIIEVGAAGQSRVQALSQPRL